ncbi:hypothetical protein WY02_16000 [Pseudonocardia sp. AL041005-10]|nr:hypothetical protein WY02_16000 [Pseudonocardia sp. AL041005-10]
MSGASSSDPERVMRHGSAVIRETSRRASSPRPTSSPRKAAGRPPGGCTRSGTKPVSAIALHSSKEEAVAEYIPRC